VELHAIFKRRRGFCEGLMVVKSSNLFTTINPINHEPVTILVERIEAEDFRGVSIESLEGEYDSTEEFGKAARHVFDVSKKGSPHMSGDDVKIYTFLTLPIHDVRQLVDALSGALQASEAQRPSRASTVLMNSNSF
jgi:hypothetical protein